jgi:hypothetical protein
LSFPDIPLFHGSTIPICHLCQRHKIHPSGVHHPSRVGFSLFFGGGIAGAGYCFSCPASRAMAILVFSSVRSKDLMT